MIILWTKPSGEEVSLAENDLASTCRRHPWALLSLDDVVAACPGELRCPRCGAPGGTVRFSDPRVVRVSVEDWRRVRGVIETHLLVRDRDWDPSEPRGLPGPGAYRALEREGLVERTPTEELESAARRREGPDPGRTGRRRDPRRAVGQWGVAQVVSLAAILALAALCLRWLWEAGARMAEAWRSR